MSIDTDKTRMIQYHSNCRVPVLVLSYVPSVATLCHIVSMCMDLWHPIRALMLIHTQDEASHLPKPRLILPRPVRPPEATIIRGALSACPKDEKPPSSYNRLVTPLPPTGARKGTSTKGHCGREAAFTGLRARLSLHAAQVPRTARSQGTRGFQRNGV